MKELANKLIDMNCTITCIDPKEPLTQFSGKIERITEDAILLKDTKNNCYHVINWRYVMEIHLSKINSSKKVSDTSDSQKTCESCIYWDKNGSCRQDNTHTLSGNPVCSMFAPIAEPKDSGSCFLTTACVSYKGLPDNCEELTILRHFRDHYMQKSPEGMQLVELYYRIAPQMVTKINQSSQKDQYYQEIYAQIHLCIEKIRQNQMQETQELYTLMVKNLLKKLDLLPIIT